MKNVRGSRRPLVRISHRCRSGLAALVLVLCGCATTQKSPSFVSDSTAEQAAVKQRLAEILNAAEMKDLPRLDSYHLYDPRFTKFPSGTGNRMDAAAARDGEHRGLGAVAGLKLRADDLKVDVFHDAAVATFIMTAKFQYGDGTMTNRERGTLVFAKDGASWKIVHEHFSAAE